METDKQLKLLHISDHHLLGNKQDKFAGIVPEDYFIQILQDAQKASREHEFAGIICSGDIVHDLEHNEAQLAQAYQIFTQHVQAYFPETPLYLCPGNHDHLELFKQLTFSQPFALVADKQVLPVVLNNYWHLLLVDSKKPERVGGSITSEQTQFIQNYLSQHPQVNVALVMHHNPLLANCAWLDSHRFRGIEEFWHAVAPWKNLRAIFHGHIHQDFMATYEQVQVLSVPATSVQFKPQEQVFTLDPIAPGYRIITLEPTGFTHQLKRLEQSLSYTKIKGY
ncbi:metallophosphoesterase [Psittacicella gerlachiana]|nr:metallophosphoesterase [Psittacicella gerlachiana]